MTNLNGGFPSIDPKMAGSLEKINEISSSQMDTLTALQKTAEVVLQTIGSGVCIIELTDLNGKGIPLVAFSGCSEDFVRHLNIRRIPFATPIEDFSSDQESLHKGNLIENANSFQKDYEEFINDRAHNNSLQSRLEYPIYLGQHLIGYMNYLQESVNSIPKEVRQDLENLTIQIENMIKHLESHRSQRRFEQTNEIMCMMAETNDIKRILSLMMESGASLINAPRATIGILNITEGVLVTKIYKGPKLLEDEIILRDGKGLTNEALKRGGPILANDVTEPRWRGLYYEFWPDTKAELAIPIVVSNAAVRIGQNVERITKPIGTLNFESPKKDAFSEEDIKSLLSLASYGGVLIEGLETDVKQEHVARMKEEILEKTDWNGTIEVMLRAIKDILGYDYVNISLVHSDTNTIKTEYVIGIPPEEQQEFKRMAIHSLDSNDIQAYIVRSRQVEVPAIIDDPRFDQKIYERFHHADMIRVFIPMIAPTDKRVIGTVEAGYRRSEHRRNIYEQDVQILKDFIEYSARALDRRQSWELGKIGHELRSPVVGISNNVRFLQRRFDMLDPKRRDLKFGDILADCAIVLGVIAQLEHYLGKPLYPQKIEQILVFRDIIIKTIRELSPLVRERGFDADDVTYSPADIFKISPIWVDKNILNQVFFNLMINAIKYSENDPSIFSIHIDVDETRESWLIKVQDWGIGVKPEYKDKIFEEGFRTPEARGRNVTGTGLGLTVSHQCMRTLGGDLQITNLSKPTEFTVSLPKSLAKQPKEVSNDSNN